MTAPTIFISYCHKDEKWKDSIVTYLSVLEQDGRLDVWSDRRIEAGDDWYQEIESAINAASIALLLVSADFLSSQFIINEEIPRLLERNAKDGLRIIPIILRPCSWLDIKWLARFMARPEDGKPLSTIDQNDIETELSSITNEINQLLKRAGIRPTTKVFVPLPPDKIAIANLPSTHPNIFGRQKELDTLDEAWDNPRTNVVPIIAWGGVGKTALVNKWLSQMGQDNYRGAERVYGWSFYSQGAAEGRQVSADQFIAAALTWFGNPEMANSATSPWDKGERLAEHIKQQRTLLILDGLEPLQNPQDGAIRDKSSGLVSLLRELARQNPGLVIISTRLRVDDLKDFKESTSLEINLENLSPEAGADYLAHLSVDGTTDERKEASKDFSGHALALTLLGSYLKVVYRGDIHKFKEIPRLTDDKKHGAHALRVMESYEQWLKGKPELDILRLMGIFDRPAGKGALEALLKKPIIEGLTVALQKMSNVDWMYTVNNLRDMHLITQEDIHRTDVLDCHPLLREYFGEKLKVENERAYREAHGRLYEYYKASAKYLPNTLEEMDPLFSAVLHGCQAGKYKETYDDVYRNRIRRENKYFHIRELGAFGIDLSLLACFFDIQWSKPVDELSENDMGIVLNLVGSDLYALGRLSDAIEPMKAGLELRRSQRTWKQDHVASITNNLCDIYLTIGDVAQALIYAHQSVNKSGSLTEVGIRVHSSATIGHVFHQAGRFAEAEAAFRQAEEIQKKFFQPPYLILSSVDGYYYCEFLLSGASHK